MIDALSRLGAGEYRDGSSTKAGWTYQPMGDFFPEMAGVPVHCAAAVRRTFGKIRDAGGHQGTLIDLGCSTGYYLAGLGRFYDAAIGFEADGHAVDVACSLGLKCAVSHDIVRSIEAESYRARVTVLALNVHMWWHKQGIADEVMSAIAEVADRLFFQTAGAKSKGRYLAPLENAEAEIAYLSAWWRSVKFIDETPLHGGVRYLWECSQPKRA